MAGSSIQAAIRDLFDASVRAKQVFLDENAAALERAINIVADALEGGHKLLLFGNGGSAADAQHLAAEFVGRSCASGARFRPSRSPPTPPRSLRSRTTTATTRCSRAGARARRAR
jgi:hypothetical protein